MVILSSVRGIGLGAVALALCLVAGCGGGPGVTQANFDRIKNDMSEEDVSKLLGGKGTEVAGMPGMPGGDDMAKQMAGMLGKGGAPNMPGGEDMAKQMAGMLGKGGDLMGQLGKMAGLKTIRWTDGNRSITCTFANGKVLQKIPQGL